MKARIIFQKSLLICYIFIVSCQTNPPPVKTTAPLRMMDDTLLNMNRKVVKEESQEIDDFLARYHWKTVTTSTGLRYMIYHQGHGIRAVKGNAVKIRYSIKLLDGREIVGSVFPVTKVIQLGRGMTEVGLEEGILLLRVEDRAKFIVPSHLAYGLLGDLKNIPERASLVYDLELLDVINTPLSH